MSSQVHSLAGDLELSGLIASGRERIFFRRHEVGGPRLPHQDTAHYDADRMGPKRVLSSSMAGDLELSRWPATELQGAFFGCIRSVTQDSLTKIRRIMIPT